MTGNLLTSSMPQFLGTVLGLLFDIWPAYFLGGIMRWRGRLEKLPGRLLVAWMILLAVRVAALILEPTHKSIFIPEPISTIIFFLFGGVFLLAWLLAQIAGSFAVLDKAQRTLKQVRQQTGNRDITRLVALSPVDFEKAVGVIFQQEGYKVTHSGRGGDNGVDLRLEKDAVKYVVQCKRYTDKAVGSPELQKFYGALVDSGASHGYFITTSRFTSAAKRYVADKPITLLDRDGLIEWLQRVK